MSEPALPRVVEGKAIMRHRAPRLAAVLPALWFVLLVGGAAIAAAAIGPAPCP